MFKIQKIEGFIKNQIIEKTSHINQKYLILLVACDCDRENLQVPSPLAK